MTWANRITIGRILIIPVFVGALLYYAQSDRHGAPDERLRYLAFGLFLVAAISDGIDGYLARHCNQRTKLGAILDPLADKLLIFSALLSLSLIGFLTLPKFPLWFPLLVISRDALLGGGALTLQVLHHHVDVKPHWTGKLSTAFVFAAICAALLKLDALVHADALGWLCRIAGLFTFASALFYIRDGTRQFGASEHGKPHP